MANLKQKLSGILDSNTGISEGGIKELFNCMKSESYSQGKEYELTILERSDSHDGKDLSEFVKLGGLSILVQWLKSIKYSVAQKESPQWIMNRSIFSLMVTSLSKMPINAVLLKKTKVGKGVN